MNRTFPEPMVARVIGVAKPRLVALRKTKLTRDTDWTLAKAVVVYTEAGLAKILAELGLAETAFTWPEAEMVGQDSDNADGHAPAATDGADEATESATKPELAKNSADGAVAAVAKAVDAVKSHDARLALVDLVVVRTSRNPSILYAVPAEGGEEVPVKVASNMNFIAGMRLQARAEGAGGSLYFLEGRCPRWRGRY